MKILIPAQHKTLYITILCFLLFSFACTSTPNVITPSTTVITVPSVTATNTLTSTYTPEATETIQPSATPIPTATLTPLVAGLGQVIFSESFDDLKFAFDFWGPVRIESGVLVLERETGYKSPDGTWPFGGIGKTDPVPADVTTLILFKATGGATFNIGYHIGDYGTESLRRFSFNSGSGKWDLFKGNATTNGNFPIKNWNARTSNFNTWHYLSIKRSANGDMDAKIWEHDQPQNTFSFHGNLGPEWGTLKLTFFIDYHLGSFMLDEYQELK